MKLQAFFCLNGIACIFPFLFNSNPNQIFDIILPELRNISILFDTNDDINEENEESAKTAISAFSFLYSSLHSNKVMDAFINWYFANIEKINYIQNYCFNKIFFSMLKCDKLKRVMVASLLKHNFFNVTLTSIKEKIPEVEFNYSYKKLLCKLLCEFVSLCNKFDKADILAIDELQKIDFPFLHEFNNFITFLPLKSKKDILNIPKSKRNQNICKFIDDIAKINPMWYKFQYICRPLSYKYIQDKTYSSNIDVKYYFYNFAPLTISALRIIFQKSKWMYQWIVKDIKSPLYQEEYEMLKKTLEDIDQNMDEYQNDPLLTEFNTSDYFSQYFSEKDLFDISNYMSIPNNGFTFISKLIINTLSNKNDPVPSLQLLAHNFDIIKEKCLENEDTLNYFSRSLSVLVEVSNLECFNTNKDFFEKNPYELVLQPQHRVNVKILSKMADILINAMLDEILIVSGHVFSFMFLSGNDDVIYKAIQLCDYYSFDDLIEKNMKIIKKQFNSSVLKDGLNFPKINYLAKLIPSFNEYNINIILFDKIIQNFNDSENKKEKIKLINSLTPDRTLCDSNIFADIKHISNDQDPPVPSLLIESNPTFWNYFIENRSKIKKIIEDNELTLFNNNYDIEGNNSMISLNLFDDYPQLYSFDFRYKLFYTKIKNEINSKQFFELYIDRENILESSYNQLKEFSENDWKSTFQINYTGEQGIDLGGLRRDWFINVSKALLDPDLRLFSISENMSYQPSIQSYANPDHFELFEFAGYLVARAIIQGEHIDGHFTHAFLRNILDLQNNLKDIEEISPIIYNSLEFILNNDLDENDYLELYFSIDYDNFDNVRTYEFIENGSKIRVTNENKLEYVKHMVDFYTRNSIECQCLKFFEGFDSLIPNYYLSIFSPNEFDIIISGISLIDVEDMKKNTEYEFPYTSESLPVILFFNSIAKWDQDDLKKLIMFITGSPKVPANGFKHYKNIGIPIKIQSGGEKNLYPTAHTCFNILSLPNYENENELNLKFKEAINQCSFTLQ